MLKKNNISNQHVGTTFLLDSFLFNYIYELEYVNLYEKIKTLRQEQVKIEKLYQETLEFQTKLNNKTENDEIVVNNLKIELEKFNSSKLELIKDFDLKLKKLKNIKPEILFIMYRPQNLGKIFFDNLSKVKELLNNRVDLFKFINLYNKVFLQQLNTFNLKNYVYFENVFFLQKLLNFKPFQYQKLFRKTWKKWKLKNKRLKKLYILKKIKKSMFFARYKVKHFKNYFYAVTHTVKLYKSNNNILFQKIPLNKKVLINYNLDFFYKLNKPFKKFFTAKDYLNDDKYCNKKNKLKIYFRDYKQKPYWKLRKSRIIHWSFFFNKTIRKNRYKTFITRFLKKYNKLSHPLIYFFLFFSRFSTSWTRISKFNNFFKKLLIEEHYGVLKLPIIFKEFFVLKFWKKRNYKLKKKIGKWSYLSFKKFDKPWLQKKKNIPKVVNHIQPNSTIMHALANFDPMTNYLLLKHDVEAFTLPVLDNFKLNYHLKLHMYRYKSNKLWKLFLTKILYKYFISY